MQVVIIYNAINQEPIKNLYCYIFYKLFHQYLSVIDK